MQDAFRRLTSAGVDGNSTESVNLQRVQSLALLKDPFEGQTKFFEGLSNELYKIVVQHVQPNGIPRRINALKELLLTADLSKGEIDARLAKEFYTYEAIMLSLMHWMQSLKPAYTAGGYRDTSVVQEQIFNSLVSNYRQCQQAFNIISKLGGNSELARIPTPRNRLKWVMLYFGIAAVSAGAFVKSKQNAPKWTASLVGATSGLLGCTSLLRYFLTTPECTEEEAQQDAYICVTCLVAAKAGSPSSDSVDAEGSPAGSPASKGSKKGKKKGKKGASKEASKEEVQAQSPAGKSEKSEGEESVKSLHLDAAFICTSCAENCHKGHVVKFTGRRVFQCECDEICECQLTSKDSEEDEDLEEEGEEEEEEEAASPTSAGSSSSGKLKYANPFSGKTAKLGGAVKFEDMVKRGERRDFIYVLLWCYHTALLELYTNRQYVFTKPELSAAHERGNELMYS